MDDQKSYSDIVSKHVMEEVKERGIDLRPPEEKVEFPLFGEKFLIERNEYEVIYINYGRLRFTCKCPTNSDLPLIGSTFMFKGTEYSVKHLDVKKKKFTFEPYGRENKTQK
jgi:hypothetical protein